jgi:hypothetical protein
VEGGLNFRGRSLDRQRVAVDDGYAQVEELHRVMERLQRLGWICCGPLG